ncbi:hypothetical protein ACFVUQ_23985 [Streptomyces cyaneofuscatus]|uniref:hypothetical protein n=1 Tax=Streptomyces cyaneofuscatus TaxID=66883 RepID=UPI0036D97667
MAISEQRQALGAEQLTGGLHREGRAAPPQAEMAFAGKWYGARCAAELRSEDPSRCAEQIVGLLHDEADTVAADFRQLRELG